MSLGVRVCPSCNGERPIQEIECENIVNGASCGWRLLDEPIRASGASRSPPLSPPALAMQPTFVCENGHLLEEGDQLCLECGAGPAALPTPPLPPGTGTQAGLEGPTTIDGWPFLARLAEVEGEPWERFLVAREDGDALLTLYRPAAEPDPAVHDALRRMPVEHVPELYATGRFEGRAYDVVERVSGGTLAEAGYVGERLRPLVRQLGGALAHFAGIGLRHRDIRPQTVLVRTPGTFDLVVAGFGSARLSDFDLEAVAPLTLTRYSAPEAIVGAVSAASDWWSLGMIVLEHATLGACFEGINDRALLLHVVTGGMALPIGLDASVRLLLRGLLARDPVARWSWPQVRAWLAGEEVEAPEETATAAQDEHGAALRLGGREFRRPEPYAMAASEAANWSQARDLTLRGALASWLEVLGADARTLAEVRRVASDAELTEDHRHALAMMALNRDLPLAIEGEIVTPAWLLADPERGYDIVTGPLGRHLRRTGREPWLARLAERAQGVRDRARLLEIGLDEARARVSLLASSRANLDAERDRLRTVFPETDHPGLSSIMERARVTDEDLLVLVSAASDQFTSLATLVDAVTRLAAQAGVAVDRQALPVLLIRPRRELFARIDDRVANFARCEVPRVDEWAAAFRLERRLALPRAAVLLSVDPALWREPPRQHYISNLLGHLEKRVSAGVSRGALARFVIGRTTPRVDVASLGTAFRSAEALVNHVIGRTEAPLALDPASYTVNDDLYVRLRRLGSQASMFRRDTGIDGRCMGFPFLLARDPRARSMAVKPRIAPVLLWPVAWDLDLIGGRPSTVAFDRERDEVRLNPALEGMLGPAEFDRWRMARDELLGRPGLRVADAMDVLAHLAEPRGRALAGVPGRDVTLSPGTRALVPAAAFFNAEFTGQAVAEDLRQLRGKPMAGTAAEVMLRAGDVPAPSAQAPAAEIAVRERDRFLTAECDPSQNDALLRSRWFPGLLVEGPPGTGKSQTIVNIVGEAIGRAESVLVICQKQAALQVVQKRLDAQGLGDRLFLVTEINRDRDVIVRALRDQLPAARARDPAALASLRHRREDVAGRIEALEGEIDRHHVALHASEERTGLGYRAVLGRLIGVEAEGLTIPVPRLRAALGSVSAGALAELEETCGPLASTWLKAAFEGSPLDAFQPFSVDEGIEQAIAEDFSALAEADAVRIASFEPCDTLETDDPGPWLAWIARAMPVLDDLSQAERDHLAGWLGLFRAAPGQEPAVGSLLASLARIRIEADLPAAATADVSLARRLASVEERDLNSAVADLTVYRNRPGFLGRLFPSWRSLVQRVERFAHACGGTMAESFVIGLLPQVELELAIRPHRQALAGTRLTLHIQEAEASLDVLGVAASARAIGGMLAATRDVATVVLACPLPEEAERAVRRCSAEAWRDLYQRISRASIRHQARQASRAALKPMAAWLSDAALAEMERRIAAGEGLASCTGPLTARLAVLGPYQRFRARVPGLPAKALEVFASLRQLEASLRLVPEGELDGVVRRSLRREALLGVKDRLENAHPELLFERDELVGKTASLAALDVQMRDLNRALLGQGVEAGRLGTRAAWDEMTRLAGPRKRRLREIMDSGPDIGLMHLRPVWLMNPDVASRVLPLRPGLFDLVIYDEASQMPVEHAVPTLYRARRAVVAGDEKQMPPSRFFSGGIEDDEAEDADEADEAATETERLAQVESWNRREVKDCPDLLQLARSVLGTTTLQIHYRSNYRELIGFSNAAYYGGALSVPARQPEEEVRRARPIEVVRVDGVYAGQTNEAEAGRVVAILAGMWSRPPERRPSVGVVTFNRKQADVIEALLLEQAGSDPLFEAALRSERERTRGGEDVGFFVKNVENVQGDERDVIVFSTTFGRDAHGAFKRSFGVLGQSDGEYRLNVAVTRARDKVVLVTSMPVAEVSNWLGATGLPGKPRDYLQAYLEYATMVDGGQFEQVRALSARLVGKAAEQAARRQRDVDGFVASVADYLASIGHAPVPADDAGDAFGLDFAIVDRTTSLFGIGIECDSPRHSLLARARAREIWRPKVLGRAVPAVHRVSSQGWYQKPQQERERLRSAVEAAVGTGEAA